MTDLVGLLPIVAIFVIFWLLVIRPQSRRQKELREVQNTLEVGDDVITNSGFFGTIEAFDGDKVSLQLAPGVVVMIARQAIVGKPADHVSEPDEVETEADDDRSTTPEEK